MQVYDTKFYDQVKYESKKYNINRQEAFLLEKWLKLGVEEWNDQTGEEKRQL